MTYDSTNDTIDHRQKVEYWLRDFWTQLQGRAETHDRSKFDEPEKSFYDGWKPRIEATEAEFGFGSPEAQAVMKEGQIGVQAHYKHRLNRHHPEHFENGVNDMTLVDVIEMLCDWIAVAERKKKSINLKYLQERFGLSDQLVTIFLNTLREIDWVMETHNCPVPQFAPDDIKNDPTD